MSLQCDNLSGELQDQWSSSLIFLLKTYIVGARDNHPAEAVLTSTHNVCFGSKIRKIGKTMQTPVYLYNSFSDAQVELMASILLPSIFKDPLIYTLLAHLSRQAHKVSL